MTEITVFDLCVLRNAVLTVVNNDHIALLTVLLEIFHPYMAVCIGLRAVAQRGGWQEEDIGLSQPPLTHCQLTYGSEQAL